MGLQTAIVAALVDGGVLAIVGAPLGALGGYLLSLQDTRIDFIESAGRIITTPESESMAIRGAEVGALVAGAIGAFGGAIAGADPSLPSKLLSQSSNSSTMSCSCSGQAFPQGSPPQTFNYYGGRYDYVGDRQNFPSPEGIGVSGVFSADPVSDFWNWLVSLFNGGGFGRTQPRGGNGLYVNTGNGVSYHPPQVAQQTGFN